MTRLRFLLLLVVGLFFALTPSSASADQMIHTGSALRVKSIGFVSYKLYDISHFMASKPAEKSRKAVIEADVSKQFTWVLRNTLPNDKVKAALKDAFAMNGYGDQAKIGQFLGAFSGSELPEGSKLTILYNAGTKTTTVTVPGGGTASIAGADFMKGVWSIWFGKIDPNAIGDQLISKL